MLLNEIFGTHWLEISILDRRLSKAFFKYKLHAEEELFEKAYSYIRQYY